MNAQDTGTPISHPSSPAVDAANVPGEKPAPPAIVAGPRKSVVIQTPPGGKLGLKIACSQGPSGESYIYINGLTPGSPAAETSGIATGDRIVEINGQPVTMWSYFDAVVHMISNPTLQLTLVPGAEDMDSVDGVISPPSSASGSPASQLNRDDNNDTDQPQATDTAAAPLPPLSSTFIVKNTKMLAASADRKAVTLQRVPGARLGLMVKAGGRTATGLPCSVIYGTTPNTAAAAAHEIAEGDHIIEVNGECVVGVSHEAVVARLLADPQTVRMVLAPAVLLS